MRSRWLIALWTVSVMAVSAHDVTYKGTVVAVDVNRYSAADGILARIEVKVSERGRPMVFDITQYTRLWRGNSPVTFTAARIQKGEHVAVTYSDEQAEKGALDIRLPSQ